MDRVKPNAWDNVKKSFRSLKWYEWVMAGVMIAIAARTMILAFLDPASSENPSWLTAVNFVSATAGVLCVFFCAKASVSNFAFGLINTVVYIVYLWYWRILGTLCLELFLYLPMGVVGWIHWARHRDEVRRERTKARKMNAWQIALTAAAVIGLTVLFRRLLGLIDSNEQVAWLDAATVAIGIVATALQTFRFREQYLWWLITDVVTVAMYIVHFDPVYLTKRSIYLIVAVIGLINWARLSRQNGENQ